MKNPLLSSFETPFQAAPFSKISSEHFLPALTENIKDALIEIDKITNQSSIATFENTLEAMENCSDLLPDVLPQRAGGTIGFHITKMATVRAFLVLPNTEDQLNRSFRSRDDIM